MKWKPKYPNVITAALAGLTLLASTTQAAEETAPATTQPMASDVRIENFNFSPKNLSISAGTTVTWINRDDVPHTATAKGDSPSFDSKALDTDEKFSFTFSKPGTYEYYCRVHPHMTGVITVK